MKKRNKKSSQNLKKHRKRPKFDGMQKDKKKRPADPTKGERDREQPLKINLPFEEAMRIVTQPAPPQKNNPPSK